MNLFDIIGPVMVGPSSSHTAGACRIGKIAWRLMNHDIRYADIAFHGSFACTGRGHGTDKALIAGLLGMDCDDERIPFSFDYAKKNNLEYHFSEIHLPRTYHPNTVKLFLKDSHNQSLEMIASSIGAGQVEVVSIDGMNTKFSGNNPTIIVENDDSYGEVAILTNLLAHAHINIATIQLSRDTRGGKAVNTVELDDELTKEDLTWLAKQPGIKKVSYLSLKD